MSRQNGHRRQQAGSRQQPGGGAEPRGQRASRAEGAAREEEQAGASSGSFSSPRGPRRPLSFPLWEKWGGGRLGSEQKITAGSWGESKVILCQQRPLPGQGALPGSRRPLKRGRCPGTTVREPWGPRDGRHRTQRPGGRRFLAPDRPLKASAPPHVLNRAVGPAGSAAHF